jgi:hypothetical protein
MTSDESPPDTRVQLLTDLDEVLFRQVHPSWLDNGEPTSQAFAPTPKDEGRLSIAQGSLTSAENAYKHYTTVQRLESAGTWAVTVGEAAAVELESFDDHEDDPPAHGFIDFGGLSRRAAKRKAMVLAGQARQRGRLYPA